MGIKKKKVKKTGSKLARKRSRLPIDKKKGGLKVHSTICITQ
jgi:hypothetical protein